MSSMDKQVVKEMIELAMKNMEYDGGCGGYCIRCSAAKAKGIYDDKHNNHIDIGELLEQSFVKGFVKVDTDAPMFDTLGYLKKFDFDMLFKTKKEAIDFLQDKLNKLKV